ncbi:Uma2 family endonuclease [Streptomyces sp. RFCAC02]|uniref:Uma2 family endonuclease n=1 Tax=Streptomyces sp. RFCAC02 TaxID=2499143 RepID=UPI001F0E581D|nr:Uma2 family endonuclease [Streptomyces sp. RFCAC02]
MNEQHDPIELLAAIEKAYPTPVRLEFLEGVPVVSPTPDHMHNKGLLKLGSQLLSAGIDEVGTNTGFRFAEGEGDGTVALVIPDLYVLRRPLTDLDEAYRGAHGGWLPIGTLALAGEVTSSNHETDTGPKYRTYAAAGVPVYLLVHRARGFAYAFSEPVPEEKRYEVSVEVKLGEPLPLPAPYPVLDTSVFLAR